MDDCGTFGYSYFKFSAKFCNALDKTKNCVFSPLLAAETTIAAKAVRSIVPIDNVSVNGVKISGDSNIPSSTTLLSPKLKSLKGVIVNRASPVCLNTTHYRVDRNQRSKIKEMFNVKIKKIDFSNNVEAADLINKVVEKKTKGKIKGFLKYNDFNVDKNVMFINGLYFKGLWHMRFDPDNTEETIFYLNNNETVNVFLMYRKEKYYHKDSPDINAQLLLLPFKSKDVYMLIVLPKRVTGLDGVLQRLADGYDLMADVKEMSNTVEVEVRIPRFTIESEIDVIEALYKLGVTTIFDKAVQKVRIDVNEEGTEPKPERMRCGFIPRWKPRPIEFTADRPHLIVIMYENIPILWVTFRGKFD